MQTQVDCKNSTGMTACMKQIKSDDLEELLTHIKVYFTYKDGALYHRYARGGVRVGARFGSVNSRGYLIGWCAGKNYLIHRLIFLYHNWYLPATIDHIDRNPLNNLIENLRESTPALQCINRGKFKGSSSIYKGVYYNGISKTNPWKAQVSIGGGKQKHLGLYQTELAAKLSVDSYYENRRVG